MSAESWKVSLACSRAEADALQGDVPQFAAMDGPPVLVTSEDEATASGTWRLDAYFDAEPDGAALALVKSLAPSSGTSNPAVEKLAGEDWVTLSQRGLEPIRAGRFFVHTPAYRGQAPADAVAIEIGAGRAFGTGRHETTTGCLIALDRMKARGAACSNILDLGTGTGLLAFAALQLWPGARIAASDIDPVAIGVARENAAVNGVALGRARKKLELQAAAGLDHRRLAARAPYDLVIANILAAPLVALAPAIAARTAPSGSLILAGLLANQADTVARAYRAHGFRLAERIDRGGWPTLRMVRRPPRRAAAKRLFGTAASIDWAL